MSELYTIEKKVPLRGAYTGRWYKLSTEMTVGDSVLVANANEAVGLVTALRRLKKKYRMAKEVGEEGSEVRRVWVVGKAHEDHKPLTRVKSKVCK